MSSFRNANKAKGKTHRERSQPASRAHLGILEKKKDYKKRAEEYHRKEDILKKLKKKALDRNPDEFYFNMVHTQKKDGVHQRKKSGEEEHTDDQIKLMCSQDQRYVDMKRTSELGKIQRLKASLHLIDTEERPKNKHTVFVNSAKEAKSFDPAKYFNTHRKLLKRRYNRPTMETLATGDLAGLTDKNTDFEGIAKERAHQYNLLKKRIEREKELKVVSQKMAIKKHLVDKSVPRKKVKKATKAAAAQYKWKYQRKR